MRLTLVDFIALRTGQSGVVNLFYRPVGLQIFRGFLGICNVTVKAYAKGFDSSDQQKAVERGEHAAC